MDLEQYKKLNTQERKDLHEHVTNPEKKETLEDLRVRFENEMEQEVDKFIEADKYIDEIVEHVGVSDQTIVEEVKQQVSLKQSISTLNNKVLDFLSKFKDKAKEVFSGYKQEVNELLINKSEKMEQVFVTGRRIMLATLIFASIQSDNHVTPKGALELKDKLKNISLQESEDLYTDLRDILSPDELNKFQQHDSLLLPALKDDFVRDELVKLSDQFSVKMDNLLYLGDSLHEKFKDKKYQSVIEDIYKSFPYTSKPSIGFLDLKNNMKALENPDYINGIKRLISLGYNVDGYEESAVFEENISLVGMNDNVYNLYKKFYDLGLPITDEFLFISNYNYTDEYVLRDKIEKGVEENGEWVRKLKDNHEFDGNNPNVINIWMNKSNDFIKSNENRFVIKYLKGDYNAGVLSEFRNDTTGFWKDFFENPKYREGINKLSENNISAKHIVSYIEAENAKNISNPNFVEAMIFCKNEMKFLPDINFLNELKGLGYELVTVEGFNNLKSDLRLAKKISINEHIEQKDFQMQERDRIDFNSPAYFLRKAKESMQQKYALENIALPVSNNFDMEANNLLEDPALGIVYNLGYDKNTPSYLDTFSKELQAEWILRTARTMYSGNIEKTEDNFRKTFFEIVSFRTNPTFTEKSLFHNRNIAFFSHNEKDSFLYEEGEDWKLENSFGKDKTINSIKNQSPKSLVEFRSTKNSEKSFEKVKTNFLNYIETQKNLTVVVDAHGGPDAIYFSNGIPQKDGSLSSSKNNSESVNFNELAISLEKRFDNGIHDIPVFIYTSCYSHDFIRNLSELVLVINKQKNKSISMPIACGGSEFGQYGYGSHHNKYGSDFLGLLLESRKDKKDKEIKLKDVINIEEGQVELGMSSNISIFIPVVKKEIKSKKEIKKQIYYQIAENSKSFNEINLKKLYIDSVLDGSLNTQTAFLYEYTNPVEAAEIRNMINDTLSLT